MGPPSNEYNHGQVWQRLVGAFGDVVRDHFDRSIAVVGFGVDRELSGLAYHLAAENGWETLGIVFPGASQHPRFPVDHILTVNPRPDDICRFYLEACNVVIRIDGSDELRAAVSHFSLQPGHRVYEYEL